MKITIEETKRTSVKFTADELIAFVIKYALDEKEPDGEAFLKIDFDDSSELTSVSVVWREGPNLE